MSSLRELRREKGLSQQRLAELLNVNQTAISQWERGITCPSSRMLLKLSQIFNINPCELLDTEPTVTYQWDDPEIMRAVQENLPGQIIQLNSILTDCSAQDQKLTFDILVELAHVLKLADQVHRATALSLLQDTFAISTRYMDVCIGATHDIDTTRIEKAQQTALERYEKALVEALVFPPD